MANFKWNNTNLNVTNFTYNFGDSNIQAKPILVDPETYSGEPTTVIIGCGKTNDTIEISGWSTKTDMDTIAGDYKTHKNYNFIFNDVTYSVIIIKLNFAYKIEDLDLKCWYNMSLIIK